MLTQIIYSKSIIILALLSLSFLNPSIQAQSKMQSGAWSVSPSLSDYSLDTNNGERSMTIEVKFNKSFNEKPTLFISVSQIDASYKTNLRYNVEAMSVSRDGFTLKVKTWADSKLFSISGNWLAYTD